MSDPAANPFLSLWLDGTGAWIGTACGLAMAELLREQMRLGQEIGKQALRFWIGDWTRPRTSETQSTEKRMAALSLRVVEGGRR